MLPYLNATEKNMSGHIEIFQLNQDCHWMFLDGKTCALAWGMDWKKRLCSASTRANFASFAQIEQAELRYSFYPLWEKARGQEGYNPCSMADYAAASELCKKLEVAAAVERAPIEAILTAEEILIERLPEPAPAAQDAALQSAPAEAASGAADAPAQEAGEEIRPQAPAEEPAA